MAVIKMFEPWGVQFARTQVRDSLMYHGEEAVALRLFREEDHQPRCPRCYNDSFGQAQQDCPVCYGTSWQGGVKDARRIWCVFTDHSIAEQYGQYGTLEPDQRMVQFEAFPLLVEHDWIVRIKEWSPAHTVLHVGGWWQVDAVTRNSLRTGKQYGQTREDVIGQAAACSWFPRGTAAIQQYPIEGVTFPEFTVVNTPVPQVITEPDTKVIYVPVPDGSSPPPNTGTVLGATLRWNPVFTFQQTAPSTVWTISHTLGHDPDVTIVVEDEVVDGDIEYPDANTVTITFAQPQTGYAELV